MPMVKPLTASAAMKVADTLQSWLDAMSVSQEPIQDWVDLPSRDEGGEIAWHRYHGLRLTEVTLGSVQEAAGRPFNIIWTSTPAKP